MNSIFEHRSIRKYKSQQIDKETLEYALKAAVRASNTGNMQLYSIVVTSDERVKEELSPSHFNQPMIKNAPIVVTFCADVNRFSKWCELRDAEPGYDNFQWFTCSVIDAMLAAQNFCVAAETKGLGVCYIGTTTYNAPEIAKTLNLPKGVIPITTITVGYPDESPDLTDRLPLEAVVHYDTYKDYTPELITELWSEKENSEFTSKLLEENELPNLAQIFTKKRYTKDAAVAFSKKFFDFVVEQGFFNHK
ncbi:MAG: nitroreductase family protein [Rikenellaceae bacterium]